MCITGSVGQRGDNLPGDARVVQALLNHNIDRLSGIGRLDVDGNIGPVSLQAIRDFQRQVLGSTAPDGLIAPGGRTIAILLEPVGREFNEDTLGLLMINAPVERIARFCGPLAEHMADRTIDTPLRQSHFLAQIGHESGELRYTEELASGEAYEGRADLGNTQPGDGPRFKGRGLIQLTGRSNYADYGNDIGEDLLSDAGAKRVSDEDGLAVGVACWFWATRGLNRLADADDLEAVTRRINGGLNCLEHRRELLLRARGLLMP